MHARQCSKLLTYPALHHSSSSSVGRRLLVTSYGYWGWDKGWIVYGMEALVRRVKVMCARSGSCACVYIGCACVLYMCVVWVCVPVWSVYTCGDQRLTSGIFLILATPPYFLRQSLAEPGESQLSGRWAPGISLSLLPETWGSPVFMWVLGVQSSCLHKCLFTHWAISPALTGIPVLLKLHYRPVSHAHVAMHPFVSA